LTVPDQPDPAGPADVPGLANGPVATSSAALAAFAAGLSARSVPADLIALMKDCVLDFIGVACAGHAAESTPSVLSAVQDLTAETGPGKAVVIGSSLHVSALHAALLNGVLGHSMDFDDTNSGRGGHPGVAVVPAALAAAQRSGCCGQDLLSGLLAGYEVAARVGAALGRTAYHCGFHPTAIAGTFGAIAAAGRVAGAPARVIEDAFGLGGSMCAGSRQYLENGAWNKRLHGGLAAHNALLALALAQAGVRGAAQPLEGRYGVLRGYSAAPSPGALTAGLGEEWLTRGVSFKPYPAPRMAHSSIDAALRFRAGGGVVSDDLRLTVRLSPAAYDLVGEPLPHRRRPRNVVDAQFSAYFLVAVALLDGEISWTAYQRAGEPRIADLAGRIEVRPDSSLPELAARVRFHSARSTVVEDVPVPLGDPANPMGEAAFLRKFRQCAVPRLGVAAAGAIEQLVHGLDPARASDLRRLHDLLGLPSAGRLPGGPGAQPLDSQ
jgi:2-methylcitrate dehydratase PrpD